MCMKCFRQCFEVMSRAKALDGIRVEEYMLLKAVILANSAAPSASITDEKHDKLKSDILGSFHDCVAATRYNTNCEAIPHVSPHFE